MAQSRYKSLYVLYTNNKYELPLCVGTAEELASFIGCSKDTVFCNASRGTVNRKFNAKVEKIGDFLNTDPMITLGNL